MAIVSRSEHRWAAISPDEGDVAYRTQSIKFLDVEERLAERVSVRAVAGLFARVVVLTLITTLAVAVLAAFFAALALVAGSAEAFIFILAIPLWLISPIFLLFLVVVLLSTTEEAISEWRVVLDGKAGASDSSYAAVYGALLRRSAPLRVAAVRVRSRRLDPDVVNNRLLVEEQSYVMSVSIFPYGSGLYVGWLMFRRRRGGELVWVLVRDLVLSLSGRSGHLYDMQRTERVRAMREVVHSAIREGVDAAVRDLELPLAETFGRDIAIQDDASGRLASSVWEAFATTRQSSSRSAPDTSG